MSDFNVAGFRPQKQIWNFENWPYLTVTKESEAACTSDGAGGAHDGSRHYYSITMSYITIELLVTAK